MALLVYPALEQCLMELQHAIGPQVLIVTSETVSVCTALVNRPRRRVEATMSHDPLPADVSEAQGEQKETEAGEGGEVEHDRQPAGAPDGLVEYVGAVGER